MSCGEAFSFLFGVVCLLVFLGARATSFTKYGDINAPLVTSEGEFVHSTEISIFLEWFFLGIGERVFVLKNVPPSALRYD